MFPRLLLVTLRNLHFPDVLQVRRFLPPRTLRQRHIRYICQAARSRKTLRTREKTIRVGLLLISNQFLFFYVCWASAVKYRTSSSGARSFTWIGRVRERTGGDEGRSELQSELPLPGRSTCLCRWRSVSVFRLMHPLQRLLV